MAGFRRRGSDPAQVNAITTPGLRTAVETIRDGGRVVRTNVKYAPLFVLAQDYDDAIRSLTVALDPPQLSRLAHEDQMTLTLFASVAHVISDMVSRGERISTLTMTRHVEGGDLAEAGSLEALEARQYTEQALVNEGLAAIASDIASMRATLAESRAEYKAESARQILDVAPYPQPGSAAAELSVLLSSNRARHHS